MVSDKAMKFRMFHCELKWEIPINIKSLVTGHHESGEIRK
jgi:hypothetical protein